MGFLLCYRFRHFPHALIRWGILAERQRQSTTCSPVGFPVSTRRIHVCVWEAEKRGGMKRGRRRHQREEVGVEEIRSSLSTKQAISFRDKGNAIRHVTVNAMHASPSGSIQLFTHSTLSSHTATANAGTLWVLSLCSSVFYWLVVFLSPVVGNFLPFTVTDVNRSLIRV